MDELQVIDAALAGEPVDPEHAELAELVLLLRDERPSPPTDVAARLDARFRASAAPRVRRRPRARLWALAPAGGLVAAAVVAIVVASSGGGSSSGGARPTAAVAHRSSGAAGTAKILSPMGQPDAAAGAYAPPVTFPGRKEVSSSELYLSTRPSHMEDVAHQVLVVVRRYDGYVNNSSVSSGQNGYSQFQLTVPSSSLSLALGDLSTLQYAQVVSRTDNTNDVTDQFNGAQNQLAQAQALRTSLLKQLQNATTQTQINAIQAQLNDANTKIASAQSTLSSLNRQISYSQISLTVQAGRQQPVPLSGGFTIGKAAHDAGRVLTVAAGVALIALAALVPVALVIAAVWWIAAAVRRHRREQALDLA